MAPFRQAWPALLLLAAALVVSSMVASRTASSAVSLLAKTAGKAAKSGKAKTASLEEAKAAGGDKGGSVPTFASSGLVSYDETECEGPGR